MKLSYFFFFIILFTNNIVSSQTAIIDSIINNLESMPEDTMKVGALLKLSKLFQNMDMEQSIKYGKEAILLSKKINHKNAEIKSYYMLSSGFLASGEVDSSLFYLKIGEEVAKKENDILMLGNLYSIFSMAYRYIADNENAIKYAYKSLKFLEEAKDTVGMYYTYNSLGAIYWDKNDTSNAKKFFLKSVKGLEEIKDSTSLAINYLALYLAGNRKYNFHFLEKAQTIADKTNNFHALAQIYGNMGEYYLLELKDMEKAKFYYKKGLDYSKYVGDIYFEAKTLSSLGDVYLKLGIVDSSVYYTNKALRLSKRIGSPKEIKREFYRLYELNKSMSKTDSALYYLELYKNLQDSLYNDNISKSNAEAYAKYDTEKKEAEIIKQKLKVELEKKKRNRTIFGGIALLLLVSLLYQWFANRQKRRNKESELALKLKNKETELALKLKNAESKNLKELNNAKSRFFANITHEFRTPLTLIMGPLQDVIGKIKGENKETLKIAHSNSQKLLTLVNDILDLSTLEEGSPELNKSDVCLFAFLKRVFYSYESYAKVRQISTEMVLPPNKDVLVNIDLEKLEKIVNNLLSNAFKYTEAGGSVRLLVELKDNNVFISVQDSGVGIDENDVKHIFERYYQGQNSENITGTGIGLSFADRLAKMMGGSISVESKRNEGSIFTLQLPLDLSKECPEDVVVSNNNDLLVDTEKSNYKVKAIFADKPRILIVEDNYEMQKYLSSILEEYFHVELAENGFEGLKKLKENKYDLVSSDVMMPGMDGFVFRQEMNKNLEWRNIPFILLTARSLKEDKLRGFKLGVDDYITKPFNSTEYIARINNLIINKQERDKWINDKMEDINLPLEKNNDSDIIEELERIILENIDDPDFKVSKLAIKSNYSQRNLSRMTKKLIGLTPVNLILEVRLQKAYQLLKSNKYKTVSEVRYEVGIDNASYFTKKFTERFGIKPGEINSRT